MSVWRGPSIGVLASAPSLPIWQPGLYQALIFADYHGAVAVAPGEYAISSSDLRTARGQSLVDMHDHWTHNPADAAREETRPMLLGRSAHQRRPRPPALSPDAAPVCRLH